jgi:transposase
MNASRCVETLDVAALKRAIHHGLHDGSSAQLLHRLHALLLAAHCCSFHEAALVGGDSLRSLQRWQRRWSEGGVSGLCDAVPHGRRRRLEPLLWQRLVEQVRAYDREAMAADRRPMTAAKLERLLQVEFGQHYSRRQCRRLLVQVRAGSGRCFASDDLSVVDDLGWCASNESWLV